MTDARATGTWLVADEEAEGEREEGRPAPEPVEREVVPGFYAGTSKGAPPPMRRGRKVVVVGGAVVAVAVAIGGGIVVLGGDDGSADPSGSESPIASSAPVDDDAADADAPPADPEGSVAAPPADDAATAPADDTSSPGDDQAPDGAGDGAGTGDAGTGDTGPVLASEVVEVVDQGWYVGDGAGSYAFTIENTSDHVLGSFVVSVQAFDLSDHVISGLQPWTHVIGTLQPYQELVVADQLHAATQVANGIGRLEVVVSELADQQVSGVRSPNDVPRGNVSVGRVEMTENIARTKVTYRAASTYEVPLDAIAYLVFRNDRGQIVGGASSFVDLPADGSVSGDFDLPTLMVSPDASQVEVHVAPQLPL